MSANIPTYCMHVVWCMHAEICGKRCLRGKKSSTRLQYPCYRKGSQNIPKPKHRKGSQNIQNRKGNQTKRKLSRQTETESDEVNIQKKKKHDLKNFIEKTLIRMHRESNRPMSANIST